MILSLTLWSLETVNGIWVLWAINGNHNCLCHWTPNFLFLFIFVLWLHQWTHSKTNLEEKHQIIIKHSKWCSYLKYTRWYKKLIRDTKFKDGIKPSTTGTLNIFKRQNINTLQGLLILRFNFFLYHIIKNNRERVNKKIWNINSANYNNNPKGYLQTSNKKFYYKGEKEIIL